MRAFATKLIADVRGLPRSVHILVGGQFINRFGGFVLPFLALYLTGRGIGMGQVALVLGSISIGGLLGPIVSGYLSDAIGRRNTIVVALACSAITTVSLYYCQTVPEFMVVAFLHGFCAFLYGPAANALLTDLVTEDQRVIAFALMRLAINAGFAAGPAVAGLLFSRAPALIFYGDAFTTLIYALLAFLYLPHGLRTITGKVTSLNVIWQSWREALVDMIHNRPFVILVISSLLMEIAFVQGFNVLAITATDRGLSPAQYGVVMALNGVLVLLIELPLNQWARRFDLRKVLVLGFALVGLGCASFGFMRTQPGFLLGMILFTIGEMLALPISMSYASTLAPTAYRGRYFGMRSIVWAVAGMVGSSGVWVYGPLGDNGWYVAGGIGVLGAIVMALTLAQPESRPVIPAKTV
uniref:MDR family MFS transporter n=1 Tax=Cephaloticoccus sp. TaxID=1985742 RepID=UPI00404948CE